MDDSPTKRKAYFLGLIDDGIRAFLAHEYRKAVDFLSRGMEGMVRECFGNQQADELGSAYLYYGRSLLEMSRVDGNPFGECVPSEVGRAPRPGEEDDAYDSQESDDSDESDASGGYDADNDDGDVTNGEGSQEDGTLSLDKQKVDDHDSELELTLAANGSIMSPNNVPDADSALDAEKPTAEDDDDLVAGKTCTFQPECLDEEVSSPESLVTALSMCEDDLLDSDAKDEMKSPPDNVAQDDISMLTLKAIQAAKDTWSVSSTSSDTDQSQISSDHSLPEIARSDLDMSPNEADIADDYDVDDDDEIGDDENQAAVDSILEVDTTEPDADEDIDVEDSDTTTDLQVAWEVLELSKLIFTRRGEAGIEELADCLIALGEVSLESENFEAAETDLTAAVKIYDNMPAEKLNGPNMRKKAQAYYMMGIACTALNKYDAAADSYAKAKSVLIGCLRRLQDSTTQEIAEIRQLLPELQNKIEELQLPHDIPRQDDDDELQGQRRSNDEEANDINHLVKRRRINDGSS